MGEVGQLCDLLLLAGPRHNAKALALLVFYSHGLAAGLPQAMGMHGGFFSAYDEVPYDQHMGEPQWRPPTVLDNHAAFQHGLATRGLNAAVIISSPPTFVTSSKISLNDSISG